MINMATVFSGIGAAEHALDLMGVDANIVFACDNGERYLKPSNKTLLKQFEEETDSARKEELARQLYEDSKRAIEEKLPSVEDPVARELAVRKLYDATRRVNYVEQSYRANYSIDEGHWFQDVRFLDGARFANKVDIFVGGSPCQSFSTYGKKGGLGDARGTLFYEYARLVQQIQPIVFIYENVQGLRLHKNGDTWRKMQEIFASLSYDIYEDVLDAVDYGLPQMRKRMFVVGIRQDVKHSRFVFPKKKRLRKKVQDFLDNEVPDNYYLPEKGFQWVTDTARNDNHARVNKKIMGCQTAVQQVNWSGDFRIEPAKESHKADPRIYVTKWGEIDEAVARKLTPTECFRLMGFKRFNISVPDRVAYRQAGDSIAVPVSQAVLKSVFTAVPSLRRKTYKSKKTKKKKATLKRSRSSSPVRPDPPQ
jgi:DNA (cytosine-5)-methyltransferase 1